LVELPVALGGTEEADPSLAESMLPLTDDLALAFAGRLSSLSHGARSLLRVAAADESEALDQLLGAASTLEGRAITLETVAEAVAAGLIDMDGQHLHFRHPLTPSAIHQAMSLRERRAVHAALASMLEGDPERRAWHRAAAAERRDEGIAADLEAAGFRAERRGATILALGALERAAQLSQDPARRGGRLVHAVDLASVLGRQADVRRLLKEIDDAELGPLDRPRAAWLREVLAQGAWSGPSRIAAMVDVADRMRAEGEGDRGLEALNHIALRCWWSNPDEETRVRVIPV